MFGDLLQLRTGEAEMTLGRGPTQMRRIRTRSQWQEKADALRAIMRQTLGAEPALDCPLASEVVAEIECGSYCCRTLRYAVGPDERIEAYVLVPREVRLPRPGVVCIHPTSSLGKEQTVGRDPSPEGQARAYAVHLVERGYVTLAYDLLTAGTRRYPDHPDFETAPFYRRFPEWSVRGKDLWDARRAVDLLQTLDEVDGARIGMIGHSQGGGITIHAAALDDRVKVGVSSCGDWPQRLCKNPFNHARTGWWVGRPFLRPYCLTGKPFPIDLHEYLALAAPRAMMNIVALNDWMYSVDEEPVTRPAWLELAAEVNGVYELLGGPGRFHLELHTQGHGFAGPQREAAYDFLEEHL